MVTGFAAICTQPDLTAPEIQASVIAVSTSHKKKDPADSGESVDRRHKSGHVSLESTRERHHPTTDLVKVLVGQLLNFFVGVFGVVWSGHSVEIIKDS